MPFITYIWIIFVKAKLLKSIIFRVKNTFEPNAFKLVIKIIFISSSPFAFLIINVKILSNFQNEWYTFGKRKGRLKKIRIVHFWSLSVLNMQKHFWFLSSFEHVNFAINGKYSKSFYDNPNYYASLVIFQTYKNVVLKSVHSLGWLLWLWFYLIFNIKACQSIPMLHISKQPFSIPLINPWKFEYKYI